MPEEQPFRSTVALHRDAYTYGSALISVDLRVSLPIPLRVEGGVHVAYLLSRIASQQVGEAPSVFPPAYVAAYDARDGMVISVRRVLPADFGRDDDPERPLGVGQSPETWYSQDHLTAQAQLFQAADRLLPAFARGLSPVPADLEPFRVSWKQAYNACAEAQLTPYHRALGQTFWSWLEA